MIETPTTETYACSFSRLGWDANDWMFIRRRDMENLDEWTQQEEHIENKSDSSHGFTSMIYRRKWRGNFTATANMAFTDRMAPSIVLAWKFDKDVQQRHQYQEYAEIVLWDGGVNAWWHHSENGKPTWHKTAFCKFPLPKNVKHPLQVSRKDKELTISVREHTFGYRLEALPDELYLGVTAAEGINLLYDFSVTR